MDPRGAFFFLGATENEERRRVPAGGAHERATLPAAASLGQPNRARPALFQLFAGQRVFAGKCCSFATELPAAAQRTGLHEVARDQRRGYNTAMSRIIRKLTLTRIMYPVAPARS